MLLLRQPPLAFHLAYNVVGVRDSVLDNVTGRKFEYKNISSNRIYFSYLPREQVQQTRSRSWVINNFSQEYAEKLKINRK